MLPVTEDVPMHSECLCKNLAHALANYGTKIAPYYLQTHKLNLTFEGGIASP